MPRSWCWASSTTARTSRRASRRAAERAPHVPRAASVHSLSAQQEGSMSITHTTIETRLAELTLVAEAGALCGVYYPGDWARPHRAALRERAPPRFGAARA